MNTQQDLVHMARPVPSRPRMPRQNRAKIFAPYQALKGFGDAVRAKDAVYVPRMELPADRQEQLDRQLRGLRRQDRVSVTWFLARPGDPSGRGQYVTAAGTVERIDMYARLLWVGAQPVPFSDITEIGE